MAVHARMKRHSFILTYFLFISITAIAQPLKGENTHDVMYKKRIKRSLSMKDPKNELLNTVYDSTGRIYSFTDIVNDAILKNKVAIYSGNDDSLVMMDDKQKTALLSYTYDSTRSKQTLLIDNIVIAEIWEIERKTGRMTWGNKWFLLCTHQDTQSGKTTPLYKLSPEGFMTMCEPYYVLLDNAKIRLTSYFKDRKFKSDIINAKTIETEFNRNFTRPKEFSEIILTH